jgi:hypothetical protein
MAIGFLLVGGDGCPDRVGPIILSAQAAIRVDMLDSGGT